MPACFTAQPRLTGPPKQLTSDVVSEGPGCLGSPGDAVLDRSAGTAALINHALAAGRYPTATVLPPGARPASNLTGMLALVALLVCTGSFAIGLGPAFGCWCISRVPTGNQEPQPPGDQARPDPRPCLEAEPRGQVGRTGRNFGLTVRAFGGKKR